MYYIGTEENVIYQNNLPFRIMKNTTSHSYPAHWHTALELIMPIEHTYTIEIAQSSVCLSPGDIFLIPSGELHTLTAPPQGSRIILQIEYSLLASFEDFPALLYRLRPYLLLTNTSQPELHRELHSMLTTLTDHYFSGEPFKEASAYASLLQFFVRLGSTILYQEDTRSFSDVPVKKQQEYMRKFHDVLSYLQKHCTENPDAETLASIAGFSVSHFIRLFRQYTGISWYSYLNHQKILHAAHLLASTELSVTAIAMQSGFNSLATFNRIFKAEKQCTPTEYKEKYRF